MRKRQPSSCVFSRELALFSIKLWLVMSIFEAIARSLFRLVVRSKNLLIYM